MQYSTHCLDKVIFQINFNLEPLKESLHPSIMELCKQRTGANLNESKNPVISILPGQKVSATTTPQWSFRGDKFHIIIQHDFLQIVNMKYTNHEEYHPLIEEIFLTFKELYKPIFTRVALRYINKISFSEGATFDFDNLVNPALLAPTLEYRGFGLTRSVGSMNIIDDKSIQTNFTYGFVNPEFPNKIAKREFILDFDCYVHLGNVIDSVKPIILDLRNKVNNLFEKSILDGLRNKMK